MTLVMVWKERDVQRFWLVSDSRLSSPGNVGERRLTDRGAKILEIPLILRSPNIGRPGSQRVRSTTLGFAYAGSSLVALQSYTAILPLWSRLQVGPSELFPSIGQCAEHLAKFVEVYYRESGSQCECILTGYDEPSGMLDAWVIKTVVRQNCAIAITRQLSLTNPGAIEVLGTGGNDARNELSRRYQSSELENWRREPLDMIRETLSADCPGSVGGGVQLGALTASGFEVAFDVQRATCESHCNAPLCAMTYRGFPFTDISRVGDAIITLRGFG